MKGLRVFGCAGALALLLAASGASAQEGEAVRLDLPIRKTRRPPAATAGPDGCPVAVGVAVGGGKIVDASRAGQPVKRRDMDIMPPYGYGRVK